MVVWIVGMSGAGKTALGRKVHSRWQKEAPNTVLVDGDEIRRIFRHDKVADAYSPEGRRRNADRIVEICGWLDSQDINVVCCILCIFPDVLSENRTRFREYFEVFVDASMHTLETRDVKNLYAPARRGETRNVVGVDIPFPRPEQADLLVDNDKHLADLDATAADILARIGVLS